MSVLVVGSTGTIGRHVVDELARTGRAVRPVVRDRARSAVLGDLASTTVVFITANTSRQVRQEMNVIDAAGRVGVSHLIKLSVPGPSAQAPLALGRDHFHIEERLRASDVPATVVRPGFITQNLLQYAGWIEPDGQWRLPLGDGAIAMVDARDVAAGIAVVVDRGAGRSINYVESDADIFYKRYVAAGNEPGYARDITTLYDEMIRCGGRRSDPSWSAES
ncbi:MAG TPA: NmrA family NAD(P)-binding protein [Pseudonocardiaceae bacterium]|nr:NmrA family NAD(P)-binding protein [Pseudonocardiaceae bacterium]